MKENLSKNLKVLRKNMRFTQAQLAEQAGLSRPAVSNIERCNGTANLETVEKIAAVFGLSGWMLLINHEGIMEMMGCI